MPAGTSVMPYQADKARPLKPELLTVALGLLFADILAVVVLQMGLNWRRGAATAGATSAATAASPIPAAPAVAMATAAVLLALAAPVDGHAQQSGPPNAKTPGAGSTSGPPFTLPRRPEDDIALKVTLKTRLAYVITGEAATDQASPLAS